MTQLSEIRSVLVGVGHNQDTMPNWPPMYKCNEADRQGAGSTAYAEVLAALNACVVSDGLLALALTQCESTVMTLLVIHMYLVNEDVAAQLFRLNMRVVRAAATYLYGFGTGPWFHPACLVTLAASGRVHSGQLVKWAKGIDLNKTEINNKGVEVPIWWRAAPFVFSSPDHLARVTKTFPELNLRAHAADGRNVNHYLADRRNVDCCSPVDIESGVFLWDLINTPDFNEYTPIEIAIESRNEGVAERMIELYSGEIKISTRCAAILLCRRGGDGGVKHELLDRWVYFNADEIPPCDPNPKIDYVNNSVGWSPWFRAVASGDPDIVARRVAEGCRPRVRDRGHVIEVQRTGGVPLAPFFCDDLHEALPYVSEFRLLTNEYIKSLPDFSGLKSWWTPGGHCFFEDDIQERAHTIMLVEHRMHSSLVSFLLPRLPAELWLAILGLMRIE